MAEAYISELGDSLSHGVANTNGDRVKIIAPKLYNDGNGNHPSIATALSGKVSKSGDTMTGQLLNTAGIGNSIQVSHGTANQNASISMARTDTGVQMYVGVGSGGSNHGVYSNKNSNWIVKADTSGNVTVNDGKAGTTIYLGNTNVGATNKPMYLASGKISEGSLYAGGTAVTLNGTSKGASTASFYAPTGAGTSGQVLTSAGSGAPTWTNLGVVCGYCNTDAGTTTKSVTAANYVASPGNTILVRFTQANTAANKLSLTAGGVTGDLYINGSLSSTSNYTLPAGTWPCYYNGTNWYVWINGTYQFGNLWYGAIKGEHQGTMRYHIAVVNTGSNPKGWCSILRVTKTSGYGSYDSLRVHGMLYDGNGNWEFQQERRIEFQAIINISYNTANLYLGKTTLTADSWIRLIKVADRDYELQYSAFTANYDLDVYYQYEGNASKYVTAYTAYTATTVTGTAITSENLLPGSIAYRADADGDGNNIKASYFKSSGNVTLVSGSATKIGTQDGTDVKLTLPTIPAAANNGALQIQLNGGNATSKFTANQSGNSTLAFSTGSTAGTFKVDSTEIAIAGFTKVEASSTNGNIKINGTETTVYTHPAGNAASKTGFPTGNASPGFGGTFKVNQITTDSTSHVSAVTERTITIPNATATASAAGLMSASDYKRLNGSQNIGEHDADACTTTGFYYGSSNMPPTSLGWTERSDGNDGALFVQAYSTSWVGQIGQDYRTGNLFTRGKNNGTFTSWKRIPYLTVKNKGGTTTPVYVDANGEIQSCTAYSSATVGTATNSTNSAVTADTTHQLYLIGATGSSGQQALKTDTGIYATATAGQLHATTFDVNSKCTLQFNTTTNALDFVFA